MSDTAQIYDAMAEAYAKKNESNVYNAYYERPATISLLPDVRGKNVLDVGCGAGALTTWLVEQGAQVTGFDLSTKLLAIAQRRLGERANLRQADLAQPLDFVPTASQDVVVASLVLHYLVDWDAPLRELHRVLKEDGVFVFSTHHPSMLLRLHTLADYFETLVIEETWDLGEMHQTVRFHHRPLTDMFAAFRRTGWNVDILLEPKPVPEGEKIEPTHYQYLMTNPHFLHFRLKKAHS
jgi:ubiquinone/menaquinone biosynthesis C-methylase UbiE